MKTLRSEFHALPPQASLKRCTKCGEEKGYDQFSKHKLGLDGLRPRCKSCTSDENRVYRQKTTVQRAAYNKRYRQNNRDRHLAYNRAWNKANRDKTAAALRRYRERHKESLAMAKALRRKLGAGRKTAMLALQRVALYGGRCYYCGDLADTIDHRIPICRGGTNLPANLVPACRSCNSRKRHRTESEWRRWSRPRAENASF